jgi:hypothetical protein
LKAAGSGVPCRHVHHLPKILWQVVMCHQMSIFESWPMLGRKRSTTGAKQTGQLMLMLM